MKQAAIIYPQFYDKAGKKRALGGVETYILNLGELLIKLGYEVTLFQSSSKEFNSEINGINVVGICQNKVRHQELYSAAHKLVSSTKGLIIFGADQFSVKTSYENSINIMHGVSWDLPASYLKNIGGRYSLLGKIPLVGKNLAKQLIAHDRLKQIENTKHAVLVDYNSINWYRTKFPEPLKVNYKVILNFVKIPKNFNPNIDRHGETITRILFARRFQKFRGTDIMIEATKLLLREFENIEVTFSGEGPEQKTITDNFKSEDRVKLTSYLPENSLEFHSKYHIAVVPSLASEGSSLSLAEAMGAGCAAIASDVGGMTNMIINNYNGIIIKPEAEEIFSAVRKLIIDKEKRKRLALNAHQTAKQSLSFEEWEKQWVDIINTVNQTPFEAE